MPLSIELRSYARDREKGDCKDILNFIHSGNIICRLDRLQLHDKLKAGGAIALKERKQARLEKAIRESKAIQELAGNPLLLTMMAILNRHQELPRDRSKLYEKASEVLLHQWDVETKLLEDPKLQDLRISLDYRDKQAMLRKIAHFMQSSTKGLAGNIISAADLETILTEHLRGLIDRGEASDGGKTNDFSTPPPQFYSLLSRC
ncbi:MAG: hypothetical protein HC778_08315 [Chamaesiphon sp. CSU_1_12]|nr:hypothetical protein [Chamaesiphon sp. CSU_1_12]